MKGVKDRRRMIRHNSSTDEPCSVVLNFLKFLNELLRTASWHRIEVINPGADKSRDQCLETIL